MRAKSNGNKRSVIFLALGLLASASCNAWYGVGIGFGGNVHTHGGEIDVYNPGGYGPYYPGGYYGGGLNIVVPNIIINEPPVRRYYPRPRVCEEVEVCNRYDECWLEQYCD